jgi:hypothetical protein
MAGNVSDSPGIPERVGKNGNAVRGDPRTAWNGKTS